MKIQTVLQRMAFHAAMGLLLMVAYPFQALYSGNQNVYFLWGMAKAGIGSLPLDPLLAQTDPFPLFSLFVCTVVKYLHPVVFHLLYWMVNSIYSFVIFGIVHHVSGIYVKASRLALFCGLFLLAHCGALWAGLFRVMFGLDLSWVWDSGIVEQGVLRGYLQPSTSGVLLLLSVHQYLQGRVQGVFLSLAAAAMIHANYLFIGAGLGAIYFILFWRAGQISKGLTVTWMAFSAFLVMPQVLYILSFFLPRTEEEAQLMRHAVLQTRDMNVHLDPSMWLSVKTLLQLGLVATAIWIFRNHAIGRLLLMLTVLFGGLAAISLIIEDQTLLSATPWRISVVLVPVSTMLVMAKLLLSGEENALPRITAAILLMSMVALAAFGYYRVFGSNDEHFISSWRMVSLVAMASCMALPLLLPSLLRNRPIATALTFGIVAATVASGLLEKCMEHRFVREEPYYEITEYLKVNATDTDVVLMPTELSTLRMNAGVAVVTDDHLVHGLHLPELLVRQADVRSFYQKPCISVQTVEEIMVRYDPTILVLPLETRIPIDLPFQELYRDSHYVLFRL